MNVQRAVLAAAVLLTALAAPVHAQAGSASSAAPAPASAQKIGVMNLRQAVFNTAEGKQAMAELQSQFAPRTAELEGLRKQIDDLQTRLRAGERTLSDDEKARLVRQGDQLTRRLQAKQQEFEEDANSAQSEVFDRVIRKMEEVMTRYARENNFTLLLRGDVNESVVIFAMPQTDITQDIIRLYDQAYPVRAGSATPAQPGTPRPQPPTKQPPPTQKPPQR
ncbi:MAG TPA: OmpH family outer membrane protein [Candidatus Acidoferrales bacterium]|nr:OmpH family outer membrane protein [Candidatus Acidoferrales bacterium]